MKNFLLSLLSLIVMVSIVHADEEVSNATFLEMATNAADYISGHSNKIPTIISNNDGTVKMNTADFYYAMARWLRYWYNYGAAPVTVGITRGINVPDNPSYPGGTPTDGRLYTSSLTASGYNTANYIDTNGKVPSYTQTGGAYVDASDLFYIFARTLKWYKNNGSLPSYTTWYNTTPPDRWAEKNCWEGTTSSTNWGTASNWTQAYIPSSDVEYATVANHGSAAVNDLQLDQDRVIGSLVNATSKKLIIPAGKSLTVNNTITTNNNNPDLILVKASSSGPGGTLIFHNTASSPVYGTVEMYSKAWINLSGGTNQKYFWQYFGLPLRSLQAHPSFDGAYVRKWDETGTSNRWVQQVNTSTIESFKGYEICQSSAKTYTLQGILENRDFSSGELTYTTTASYPGQHIFGNSYTAAIDITKITFGSNMEATVYLYNTGSYNNWVTNSGGTSSSPTNTNPGTYAAIPKNQAGQGGIQGQIPSMQGFLVKAMSSATGKTISISYSSVVVKNTTQQRAKAAEGTTSTDKQYVRIDLKADSFTVDRMWIFNEPNCTRSFDNGWDGPKILAGEGVPALFSEENDDIYQVNSVEDMSDTNIGFQGEDNKVYSLEIHSENLQQRYASIYLYDKMAEKITEISSDSTVYTFTNNSGTGTQQRFKIITILTGVEGGNDEGWPHIFPLNKRIGIENKNNENGKIKIYDLMGRMVDNFSVQPQTIQVSPRDLTTGVYVVKVFTQDKKISKKIVIR